MYTCIGAQGANRNRKYEIEKGLEKRRKEKAKAAQATAIAQLCGLAAHARNPP
jgi:hypothetical protein